MTLPRSARFVFAGGGTGGHLYPALAIADRLYELLAEQIDVNITFIGTQRGIEYRLRDQLGYPLELINIRGLVRSFTIKNLLLPFVIVSALIRSWSLLRSMRPDVVIGTGGYVAWPVLRAAAFLGLTTVVQEQNSYPGIVTRSAAGRAARVYLGFDGARAYLPKRNGIVTTGNPVRSRIATGRREVARHAFGLDSAKRTIAVIGGSQGARALNQAVLKSVKAGSIPDHIQILWQTGKGDYKDVVSDAGEQGRHHSLFPFAENMELVYAAADVAIARAGALTMAELLACGVPSVLVPYPQAAGDHQRKNAAEFAEAGFAVMCDQKDLATHDIVATAAGLLDDGRADEMRAAMQQHNAGRRPAVDMIAEDIIGLLTTGEPREGGSAS